ncbi:MAG: insulinase family protein [Candidatus Gastranaerophilales bacterium]|nr:insulinase family protein [Candidatus Gastranaerophilales bacterium]
MQQITSVGNSQIVRKKQNFKGSSANSDVSPPSGNTTASQITTQHTPHPNPLPQGAREEEPKLTNYNTTANPSVSTASNTSTSPFSDFTVYKPMPSSIPQAYAAPQITQGYREIGTFDVPYIGKGKLYQLANGHKVAVIPKEGASFTINTCVKTGKKEAPIVSHFLEHLVCDIDKEVDGQTVSDFLNDIGGTYQASTRKNHTNYLFNAPINNKDDINKLIKIQSKFFQSPDLSLSRIEKEKQILISENAVTNNGDDNQEDEKINYLMLNRLFNLDEKPEKIKEKISIDEEIKVTNFAQLSEFYNKYYNNNNMFTVIEGDVNPDDVIKTFSSYFNKPNKAIPNKMGIKPDLSTPIQITKRIDLQPESDVENNIQVGFVGPKNNDDKSSFIAHALITYIESNELGYKMDHFDTEDYPSSYSFLSFSIDAKAGKEEEKLKELYQKLFDLTQKPISDEDFNALKLKLKDRYSMNAESARVLPEIIGKDFVHNGRIKFFDDYKYIDLLTKEDLQDFAKKYIDFNKAVVIIAHNKPKNEEKLAEPSFTGKIKDIDTKDITEYKYPNNLQLLVDNSQGITRTAYRVNLTSNEIPDAKPGVLEVLREMLENDFKDDKIFKAQCLGADFDIRLNSIDLSISVLPEQTGEAIDFVNSKLQNPKLTQEQLYITKAGLKAYYKVLNKDKTTSILRQHEYGNYPLDGFLAGISSQDEISQKIDAVQLEDVVDLYQQIIKNAQGKAILVIPKDLFEKQRHDILVQIGAGYPNLQPKGKVNFVEKLDIKPIEKTKIIFIPQEDNFGGVTQKFQIVNTGDLKGNLTLKLLSNVLGDNGRLKKDIREEKGLAYTAGTYYESDGPLGYFSMGTHLALARENAGDLITALNSIKANTDRIVSEPVSGTELEHAKNQLKSDFATLVEFSKGRAELLNEYGVEDVRKLFKIIDEITPEDIQNIAKEYLDKPSLFIIDANKDVLDANKDYLATLGEIVDCK